MSAYLIIKLLHMSGAIGYFAALGSLLFGLAALRRAQRVEQARAACRAGARSVSSRRALAALIGRLTPLFIASILVILIAGLYMTFTVWSFQTGWIDVALAGLLIIAPATAATVQIRMGAIAQLARATPDGPLPVALLARMRDPALWLIPQTATILLLGIVFLMTNKPDLPGSLLVMAIALVARLVPWLLLVRHPRVSGAQVVAADTARPAGPAT